MKNTISLLGGVFFIPALKVYDKSNTGLIGAIVSQMVEFGYKPDGKLISALFLSDQSQLLSFYANFVETAKELTGADVAHNILFPTFPNDIPDMYSYALTETYGLGLGIGMGFNTQTNKWTFVSDRGVVPPSSGITFNEPVDLKVLTFFTEDDMAKVINEKLNSQTSLSRKEKILVRDTLDKIGAADIKGLIYKENLPIVAGLLFDSKWPVPRISAILQTQMSGAVDVLRIAAYLTDNKADTSLSTKVRFKLKSPQRRLVFELLESMSNIEEDLLRHREKFLRLGENIHPASPRRSSRYPKTAQAYHVLRNAPKSVWTFNRQLHGMLEGTKPFDAKLMKSRPTLFARHLDALVRGPKPPKATGSKFGDEMMKAGFEATHHSSDPDKVLSAFYEIMPDVKNRVLMQLYYHFRNRNSDDKRFFIPKGTRNSVKFAEDYRAPIAQRICDSVCNRIYGHLLSQYAKMPSLGKVWIDPDLFGRVLPYNKRGDSDSSTPIEKGSAIPFDHKEVVRLFVHWSKARDVDLSMAAYDENWNQVVQVSYTNLRGEFEAVHSGDITSGWNGATEYIDFNVSKFLKGGARYVVPQILSYSGEPFSTMNCFAGFMKRAKLGSGELFEPATVESKFVLDQPVRNVMPLIFDLVNEKIIYLDSSGEGSRNIEGNIETLKQYAELFLGMPDKKPTLGWIAEMVVLGSGSQQVDERSNADVVFDFDTNVDEFMDKYIDHIED